MLTAQSSRDSTAHGMMLATLRRRGPEPFVPLALRTWTMQVGRPGRQVQPPPASSNSHPSTTRSHRETSNCLYPQSFLVALRAAR